MKVFKIADVADAGYTFRFPKELPSTLECELVINDAIEIDLTPISATEFTIVLTQENLDDIKAVGVSVTAIIQIDERVSEKFIIEVE